MSNQPRQRTSIGITSADYYFSHELARELLERQGNAYERVVLTVRDPKRVEGIAKHPNLVIKVVDGQDQNKTVEALKNLDWVILVPEPEDSRVQLSQKIIEASQQAGVKNILLQSSAAAEASQASLKEFKQIEQKLQQTGLNWTIFRNQFVQNWFHLWSYAVQDRNEFPITFQEKKLVPVLIQDIVRATHELASKKELGKQHKGQIYTFTGPEKLSGTELVRELNEALEVDEENEVKVRKVSRQELEKYLRDLRESSDRNGRLGRKLQGQPTEKQIQTILDWFDWVNTGQAETQTDHLRQLIGKNGERIQKFFQANQAEFRGNEGRDDEFDDEDDLE